MVHDIVFLAYFCVYTQPSRIQKWRIKDQRFQMKKNARRKGEMKKNNYSSFSLNLIDGIGW